MSDDETTVRPGSVPGPPPRSLSAWGVPDRGFTGAQREAVAAVLESGLGGPERVGLAFLGGSFAVGLGHGTSDIDLYAVGPGVPAEEVVLVQDGVEVHVNPIPAGKLRELIGLATGFRVTGADRSQAGIDAKTLNALVRLATGQLVHADAEWLGHLEAFDANVVRQILILRNGNIFAGFVEDAFGALASGDLLTAATASALGLEFAAEAVLAAAGDVYVGPKFLFRRLARTAATAPWCDPVWRLAHRELHPESGRWPDEVREVVEQRLWAGGLLVAYSVVEGWDKPLTELPAPSGPHRAGPRRNPYFTPLRFTDGWALIGPGDGYEVAEDTVRLWRELDGRPLAEVARRMAPFGVGDVEAVVAALAVHGAVEGYQAAVTADAGGLADPAVIRPAPRFACHPRAAA